MNVFLAQLWATIRQYPLVSLALFIAVVAGVADYSLWDHRAEVTRQHEDRRTKGQAMLAALTDRARINQDLDLLADAQDAIDRNLVSEDNMEVNLGYFYRLEKLNRVRLVRVDQMGASAADAESPFKSVPVSLQISGNYRNLLAFVRDLEIGPRILRIRSFRLERADASGNELSLILTVELLART